MSTELAPAPPAAVPASAAASRRLTVAPGRALAPISRRDCS